jgi:hypothetical protein
MKSSKYLGYFVPFCDEWQFKDTLKKTKRVDYLIVLLIFAGRIIIQHNL